jgi:RNA polymerase sigma-70 factor (ECF subfamily)
MAARLDDREIIASCRRGEERGFRALLEAHQEYVFRLCWRMTGSRHTAMDLTQEVLIRVLRALPNLRPDPSLRPWLRRVATNLCLDETRRSRERGLVAGGGVDRDAEGKGQPLAGDPVAETVTARAEIDRVARFLDRLAPQRRAVLILSVVEDLGCAEIAGILGLPEGTVKSHRSRARSQMRRAFLEEEGRVVSVGLRPDRSLA